MSSLTFLFEALLGAGAALFGAAPGVADAPNASPVEHETVRWVRQCEEALSSEIFS